ncbi:MAG: LON peptidase substrate-binding domain-containing protein [Nocardioides sp.]
MSRSLPLFPLSTVLYPGLMLPLHIFEERYRVMVGDLLAGAGGGSTEDTRPSHSVAEFGVIALRHGHETGPTDIGAIYDVGCTARVRRVSEVPGGRYDLVTTGTQRFRVLDLGAPAPYLLAVVEPLDDPLGDPTDELTERVFDGFALYLDLVSSTSIEELVENVPHEPRALSYLVAATMALSLPDRQRLLEAPDAAARLTAERHLLGREIQLIRALGALPATDLTRVGFSPN